ncbi:hypothetical protein RB601_004497 [Gaeumannomyces tritici]
MGVFAKDVGFEPPALPYFCDTVDLPGPLPTLDEIEAAETTLPSIYSPSDKRVVVVRGSFVVKYGKSFFVDSNEGHALMLLRQRAPDLPTPMLYAMYRHGDRFFLVMQYLPGRSLESHWDGMSEDEKTDVMGQLHGAFARLRGLPPPSPPLFGSVAGGPVPHRFFHTPTGSPAITGPFRDEAAFHDAMALHLRQDQADDGRPQWTSRFLSRHVSSAMGRHACVLTHGDLQRKNILVVEAPPLPREADIGDHNPGPRRLTVSGIVDWEGAGWMPSYWEYASVLMLADWSCDWTDKFEIVLDAWPSEVAMLMFVRQNFDGY